MANSVAPIKSLGPQMTLTKPRAPAAGLSGRTETVEKSSIAPGPGTYTSKGGIGEGSPHVKAAPAASMPKMDRFGTSNSYSNGLPGPGAYKRIPGSIGGQAESVRPSSQATQLSGRTRIVNHQADTMGPGVCREDSFLRPWSSPNKKRSPSYSLGAKVQGPAGDDFAVGPGSYTPSLNVSTRPGSPAFSMGSRLEEKVDVNDTFTCRNDSAFAAESARTPKGFSFGGRQPSKDDSSSVPGPGAYGDMDSYDPKQPSSRYQSSQTFKFGSGDRPDLAQVNKNPGPGQYNRIPGANDSQVDSTRLNTPSHRFGDGRGPPKTSKKKTKMAFAIKKDRSPGPGTYRIPSAIGKTSDSRLRSAPASSLGSREKFGAIGSNVEKIGAGPAAFNFATAGPQELISQRQSPKYQFATAKRLGLSGPDQRTPGPGQYQNMNMNTVKQRAPKYSMGERTFVQRKGADSVGPGRCRSDGSVGKQVLSDKKSYASHSFGSRTRFRDRRAVEPDNPGPGSYG